MSKGRSLALVAALGIPVVALAPWAAAEDPKPGAKPLASARPNDPDNITGLSQSLEVIVKGNERYLAKDYPGAIDQYRKAIVLAPRSALAYYALGEAHLAMSTFGEADAALKSALELSDPKEPAMRAHVLFAIADSLERQKKWAEAKQAWAALSELAARAGDAGIVASAAPARIKALDEVLKLEAQYVEVRARIAADKDGGSDGGKPKK